MAENSFRDYLKHAWNVFNNKDPVVGALVDNSPQSGHYEYTRGYTSYYNPEHKRLSPGIDRTLAAAIYSRIATDAAQANFRHVRVDSNGTFQSEMNTGLNNVLKVEANKDQTARAFMLDFIISILDEGVAAAVPIETTINPTISGSYDILSMRTGKLVAWQPDRVRVQLYNDRSGLREELWLDKSSIAIVENPFYNVMNEPNSTLRRLTHKLSLLDSIDDSIASKKLDLIIQLPYVVKNKTKQEQADERRKQLEAQLENSKLGVGYIDGTERVIQLNRSLENNIMSQVEYLTSMLYSQLGITAEIMNGTANESTMMNYYKRTVDVILQAIADEFKRKFLTKTGRTQGQSILFHRDPFSLTPTTVIADIADKFTRNEILSPNEVRGVVGFMPSSDEAANELRNRNISQTAGMESIPAKVGEDMEGGMDNVYDVGEEVEEAYEDPYTQGY